MHKAILVLPAFLILFSCHGQFLAESEIPGLVKHEFELRFRNTSHVLWRQQQKQLFEAVFNVGKVLYKATFHETGNWMEIDKEITKNYLPKEVKNSVARKFSGFTVVEAEKVELVNQDTSYKVYLKNGHEVRSIQFSSAGQVIKNSAAESYEITFHK